MLRVSHTDSSCVTFTRSDIKVSNLKPDTQSVKAKKSFARVPLGICKLESQKEFWNPFTKGYKNNHFRLLWSASVHYQKSFAQSQAVFMSEKVLGYAAVWVRERREIKSICWIRFCEMFCAMSKGSLSLSLAFCIEKNMKEQTFTLTG